MEIYTFSQRLAAVMQKHRLTLASLSSLIGGRAELKQILSDDGTQAKRERLYEKLQSAYLFDESDYQKLTESLEISRIGIENFRFQRAIDEILSGKSQQNMGHIITDNGCSIRDRFETLQNAEKIEILCFNCCFHALIDALLPLFKDPQRDITLQHYVQADSFMNAAAEYVAVVLPLLFDARYAAFYRPNTLESKLPCIGGNQIFVRAVIDHEIREMMFALSGDMIAYELPNASSCHMYAFISRVLQGVYPQPIPIKETHPYKTDLSSLCMTFLSHELNRATYYIGSDLCFQQTPTDIVIAAIEDKEQPAHEDITGIINRSIPVHEQRYRNQYHKKKPTYRIMTHNGCERFLATGQMTDHFADFRPFTPAERKVIFGNMLQAAQTNRFFVPLLLKKTDFHHVYNLTCYDKLGVSIDFKDAGCSIADGYRSVFLTHPEFTRQYQTYYLEQLVAEKCHTRTQSLQMLEDMYERFLKEYHL